jgi:hypothetical protein
MFEMSYSTLRETSQAVIIAEYTYKKAQMTSLKLESNHGRARRAIAIAAAINRQKKWVGGASTGGIRPPYDIFHICAKSTNPGQARYAETNFS